MLNEPNLVRFIVNSAIEVEKGAVGERWRKMKPFQVDFYAE